MAIKGMVATFPHTQQRRRPSALSQHEDRDMLSNYTDTKNSSPTEGPYYNDATLEVIHLRIIP